MQDAADRSQLPPIELTIPAGLKAAASPPLFGWLDLYGGPALVEAAKFGRSDNDWGGLNDSGARLLLVELQ